MIKIIKLKTQIMEIKKIKIKLFNKLIILKLYLNFYDE